MTGVSDFLSPQSQVSLLSIPEGEIHLVIPLRVDTFAHCGQFGLLNAARTFQNKGPCIAEAGEGGPLLDEPVCPAPRGVALSAVCLQPPATTPKTSQEPLKWTLYSTRRTRSVPRKKKRLIQESRWDFPSGIKKKESGSDWFEKKTVRSTEVLKRRKLRRK